MDWEKIKPKDWPLGSSLRSLLNVPRSPISVASGDRQLEYISRYIEKPDLHPAKQRCILVEAHYIDRDFLEDCGVFYVQNLKPPENHCRRVHFFACDAKALEDALEGARHSLRLPNGQRRKEYNRICKELSEKLYLGYTVIRPLPGCPIGRTVLRCLPETCPGNNFTRIMSITRVYHAHVGPLDLQVRGLAFQQQDRGVSACATVAIWSAFHRLHETDEITIPSPSKITRLATQFALPFGRSMPASEGLNISQMSVAIEVLQMSPALATFREEKHGACKQAIWSAVKSGYPAILILGYVGIVDERLPESRRLILRDTGGSGFHAVTVVGLKQAKPSTPGATPFDEISVNGSKFRLYRAAQSVVAAYIHDDRIGPYRRAEFTDRSFIKNTAPLHAEELASSPGIRIRSRSHSEEPVFEHWAIQYLLLPLHPRIRMTLGDLEKLSIHLSSTIVAILSAAIKSNSLPAPKDGASSEVLLDFWIERGHTYQHRIASDRRASDRLALEILERVGFPRHVGVLRFEIGKTVNEFVDILIDTTSNLPNEHFLLIAASDSPAARFVAAELKRQLNISCLT